MRLCVELASEVVVGRFANFAQARFTFVDRRERRRGIKIYREGTNRSTLVSLSWKPVDEVAGAA
jgi:hypothetical protein